MRTLLWIAAACSSNKDDTATDPDGGGTGLETVTSGGDPIDPIVATDLIRPTPYAGLRVEIDYVAGKGPDPEALDLVRSELAAFADGGQIVKPGGIEVVLDEEVPALGDADTVHTLDELDAVLKSHAG